MRRPLLALAMLLAAGTAASAADDMSSYQIVHEVKGGILYHDMDYLWSNFSREEGWDVNLEVIFAPSLEVFGGHIRPAVGGSINTGGDTSKGYIDARWQYDFDNGLFGAIGLGAAIHNGDIEFESRDRKALGSRVLFHIPLEVGYYLDEHHGVSLYFDHISNGYFADPNEGMDTLGVRYGYRF